MEAVQAAVSGMFPGPFAYAEQWGEDSQKYLGLLIEKATNPLIVIDRDSVIIKPDVAEAHRPALAGEMKETAGADGESVTSDTGTGTNGRGGQESGTEEKDQLPTRFIGTVMISPDRPARDMHQIVETIVEQLTTVPGSDVSLRDRGIARQASCL